MPKVTFAVPCYNLAHLLPECVESLLAQTFTDFEVLIMDDASPDDTPAVAAGFADPRVRHVRNEVNLRQLRNYNRGIELARGEYVWLISADDRLRRPHALETYVRLLDAHPQVGYVICPGVGLRDGRETEVLAYSKHADTDTIFDGREFLARLLRGNTVIAASGLVRRALYERHGGFPLDLPYAGDWYLWLLFALHSDVGYVAEPMVNYREHAGSATTAFMEGPARLWKNEGIAVAWRIRRAVEEAGHAMLARECERSLIRQYSSSLRRFGMSGSELEQSLRDHGATPAEARRIRAGSHVHAGDEALRAGDRRQAAAFYSAALAADPMHRAAFAKSLLLRLGGAGDRLRGGLTVLRGRARRNAG